MATAKKPAMPKKRVKNPNVIAITIDKHQKGLKTPKGKLKPLEIELQQLQYPRQRVKMSRSISNKTATPYYDSEKPTSTTVGELIKKLQEVDANSLISNKAAWHLQVYIDRPETDAEYQARVKKIEEERVKTIKKMAELAKKHPGLIEAVKRQLEEKEIAKPKKAAKK